MMTEQERAASALFHLDAGCSREDWIKVGMAAKAAGLAFDDFHSWSASAGNYSGERDCLSVWNSFNESGPVTENSLFAMAYAQGWQNPAKRLQAANGSRNILPIAVPRKAPVTPIKKAESAKADEVWGRCEPAPANHAYIARKGGLPDGLRIYPNDAPPLVIRGENVAGWLVVPCHDLAGNLQTLQFIPNKGDKLNLAGSGFRNGCHVVGDISESRRVFIVEGIGQAWAAWKATGCAAVACFGAGRMATVADALRDKYPSAHLVVLPDRGKENQAEALARAIKGKWCELPIDKPGNYDANDLMIEHGADALGDLLEHPKEPAPSALPLSVTFADELPDTFTPPDELVEGVLTAGAGSVLYGDSNSGKTFFVIDMAAAVARGMQWMGRKTEPGMVVYLAAESPASVQSRLQAYQKHHGVKVPNFAIVQSPIDLFDGESDTNAVIQLVQQLERQQGQKVRLIIGDTLARLSAGANENAGQDMGLVVRRFDRIRIECNAHFMMVHHSGKNSANGARGWSGIRAAMDTEIEVTDSPTGRCAEITKQRDLCTKGERIGFRLETVTLGLTKWKALATSCIVVPADAPAIATGKRISEVGGAILEMLRTRGAGIKKAEAVKHFDGRYDKSSIYRELKKLRTAGQVHEYTGIVTIAKNEGAKGAD